MSLMERVDFRRRRFEKRERNDLPLTVRAVTIIT